MLLHMVAGLKGIELGESIAEIRELHDHLWFTQDRVIAYKFLEMFAEAIGPLVVGSLEFTPVSISKCSSAG